MSIHTSVVNLLVSLGYTKSEGCCHGFSLRWLEACLLDEEGLFDARIQQIVSGGGALVHSIYAVKEKKGQNLTAQDKELLDILAFFDSLELYQFPHAHLSLFNAPLVQNNVEIVSKLASSDAIFSRGGLARIYSEPVIYTKKEMKAYFDGLGVVLEKVCAKSKSKDPLGIVLSSYNHAIALTYTPGKGWKFMDINQYPTKLFAINKTNLLAECIMTGFFQSNSPYRAFNVSVYTTAYHLGLLNLKGAFAPFKKSHQLTKEVASRETEGIGLARITAQESHIRVIGELAKYGVDLNKADREGITPAYIAAQNGHALVITKLAKYKVDLNQVASNGVTLAYVAAHNGHSFVIAELAKHKVDLNTAKSNGGTPAFIAAQNGHAPVIAELAKHKVDLNKAKSNGVTPVFIAAQNGYTAVIAELAKHGANLNQAMSNGATPAIIAAQKGHASVIAELAKYGVDFNQEISTRVTPAFIAAKNGHSFVIAELAKHQVNLNQAMSTGLTPAFIAAEFGHASVIAELAKHGVNLNQAISNGATPAIIAAQKGHASVVSELATYGVDLNQAMSNGMTPAIIAAKKGHVSVIAELIKIRVNFNIPYTDSVDNLRQFAISLGDKVIERMNEFIAQQLALSPTSHMISMTPYHIAFVMGHSEIMQLLTKQEKSSQNQQLYRSPQLMERTKSGYDKTIENGHTFFSSLVKEDEAINGVNQQEHFDVYQDLGKKRKLGALDDEVLSENDKKRTCYPL